MTTAAPNADRIKIVVYSKDTTKPPVMAALVKQLESQKARLDCDVLTDPTAVLASVEKTTMTVLILALAQKEELVEILNVLTQVHVRFQSGLLRVIVLNGMEHPRVIALLKAKGVQEIIEFGTNIKALNHKIKNAFLLVTQAFQRLQNQNIRAATVLGGESEKRNRSTRSEASNEIQWVPPVDHPGDFWWIPSQKNLRNVMGRWLMDILGPGPAAGTWEETTYERNGERGWVWRQRVSTDTTFMPRAGRWVFFGRMPEFVWQKNLWAFVSKMPYLAFYAEGEKETEYVRIDSAGVGKLKIYENSETARSYLPKVQASLEASLKLSKGDKGSEVRGNFDPSVENSSVGLGDFIPSGNVPTGSSGGNYSASSASDAPPADWNDHTGAVGFAFKAKDLRVDQNRAKGKWRNALTADVELGVQLGLDDVKQKGLATGAKSFDRLVLDVYPLRRNGVEIAKKDALCVIELTNLGCTFEAKNLPISAEDKLQFRVEFRLGDVERKFELEWIAESVQAIEGAGSLIQGRFLGGHIADLTEILKIVAQRQLELKDFFLIAKGA